MLIKYIDVFLKSLKFPSGIEKGFDKMNVPFVCECITTRGE